ncbi:MAG TPA: DUF3800 domain-containing protein [Bryobacteraceae bacterium]|nr:DUF3800 domain-containing protein [Bryobacteraceae bacterium]
MLFKLYCDESYDGSPPANASRACPLPSTTHEPRTFVIAGLFSDQATWSDIESRWATANKRFGVSRYHASHLNCKTYEYEGWDDERKILYSSELLGILTAHGRRLHVCTCGMLADKYREVISDVGRMNMGQPYLACFGTFIALVARDMDQGRFPPEDQIALVIDRSRFQGEASQLFYDLKDNPHFPYRHRLATCTPADSTEMTCLQPADMVAYETFKRLHVGRQSVDAEMRKVFAILVEKCGYDGGNYFSEEVLRELKTGIESTICRPGRLIVIPPQTK